MRFWITSTSSKVYTMCNPKRAQIPLHNRDSLDHSGVHLFKLFKHKFDSNIILLISTCECCLMNEIYLLPINKANMTEHGLKLKNNRVSLGKNANAWHIPEAVIWARKSRKSEVASICKCPHSVSPTTVAHVRVLYLAWTQSMVLLLYLNFSTLSSWGSKAIVSR